MFRSMACWGGVGSPALAHSHDSNQRLVPLMITSSTSSTVTVTTPPNTTHATQGWYMMFLVSSAGIPSVAHWIRMG